MKTFKAPKRILPAASEVTAEGNLILAYPIEGGNILFYEWNNQTNTWSFSKHFVNISNDGMDCLRRPLSVLKKFGNIVCENCHIIKAKFGANECVISLATGSMGGYRGVDHRWEQIPDPVFLSPTHFGILLVEYTNIQKTRVNIYVSEFDWNSYDPINFTYLEFRKFGYFTRTGIGFQHNPHKAVTASILNDPGPFARLYTLNPEVITEDNEFLLTWTNLPLPKNFRMLCGFPTTGDKSIGLIGHKGKGTGDIVRFYDGEQVMRDFNLPKRAHSMHISHDMLTLTVIGHEYITQIDLD